LANRFFTILRIEPVPKGFLDTVVHGSLKVPATVWQAVLEGSLKDVIVAGISQQVWPPTRVRRRVVRTNSCASLNAA
jgi:hypothetical protein